jgi:hypothetical protein
MMIAIQRVCSRTLPTVMVAMSLLLIHPYAASAGGLLQVLKADRAAGVGRAAGEADRAAGVGRAAGEADRAAGEAAGRRAGEAQSGADGEVGRQLGEKPGRATGKCVVETLQDSGGGCNDPQ